MKDFELKDFIAESLKQIIEGIEKAQTHAQKKGALINPSSFSIVEMKRKKFDNVPFTQDVEFDVAVTLGKLDNKEGSVGIFPISSYFGLGGKLKAEKTVENVSRIKFKIPVRFPTQVQTDLFGN